VTNVVNLLLRGCSDFAVAILTVPVIDELSNAVQLGLSLRVDVAATLPAIEGVRKWRFGQRVVSHETAVGAKWV
jgi:hypothetical protein